MKRNAFSALRRVCVVGAVLSLVILAASTTLADGNGATTFTQTFHNAVTTMPSGNPCSGVPGDVTLTYNGVFHITSNKAGDFWVTGNQTGDFSFVPSVGGAPSYSGNFHLWFGDSSNNQNDVNHFTFQLQGVGSDGSVLTFHETEHVSTDANGNIVVSFDKMTCG